MDEKLTDNEIKKAIEAMLENYYGSKCQVVKTLRLSFDLIKRLKAENENKAQEYDLLFSVAEEYKDKAELLEIEKTSTESRVIEQQAEIDRLHKSLGKEFTCFVGDPHRVESCPYLDELEKTKAKNERLRQIAVEGDEERDKLTAEIKRLNSLVSNLQDVLFTKKNAVKFFKSEAIKEFAERLCEDRVSNDPVVIAVKAELKEMTGQNDFKE